MNCQQVADDELVERYLNGQLEAALQDDLEVHMLECPGCLERAEALRLARAGLAERAHEIRRLPARRALHLRLAWLGVAAALVAVCGVAWYEFRSGFHQPRPQAGVEMQSLHPAAPPVISQGANPAGTHEANPGSQVTVNPPTPGQKQTLAAGASKKRAS